jgi:MFS family permease
VPVLARYTTAAALARVADEGARVALLLLVLQRGHGPAFGGLLVAALMVPHVAAAPLAGAIADRVRRRRLLYVAGLLTYGLGVLGAALLIEVPAAAFALVVVAGCAAPLLIGGLSSLLGEIVPGDLRRAFGLDAMSYGAAGIAGPALAALIAGIAGGVWAAAALTLSCAAAAALVLTLPVPDRAPGGERPRSKQPSAIPVLWRRPALGAVTAGSSLSQVGLGALPIVTALIAADLHDAAVTGLALSTMAAGGLLGSLACARWPIRRVRPETVVLAGLVAQAVPFAVLRFVPGLWPTLLLFALAGLATAPVFSSLLVVRDREAPPEARTQVFTIGAGLKVTAAAAGAALAGLATGLGAGTLLLLVAAGQVLAGGAGVLILRRRPAPPASPAHPSRAATPASSGR